MRGYVPTSYTETKSITTTHCQFRCRLNIDRHSPVPPQYTGSVRLSFSSRGHTVLTPENVRLVVQQGQRYSALRHATAFNLSHTSICHIMHKDLGLHPSKVQVTQKS
jgi:hypothetical protein